MRAPSSTLVLDATILISAVVGRSTGAIMEAQSASALITTDRVVHDAHQRLELGLGRPELVEVLDDLATALMIVPVAALEPLLASCEVALRDAHVLALAWSVEADVWTTDRDFAGTGIATWSTPNLMRKLAEAVADKA